MYCKQIYMHVCWSVCSPCDDDAAEEEKRKEEP